MKRYPFSEVITDVTSKFRKIKASDYKIEGRYKIIDQGQKEIAGYTDDESLVNKTHSPIIVFGDHTRVLKYEESSIALGADGAKALSVNPKLADARYIYYYLRSINLKEAGYSRHFKFLKQVEIPIPEDGGKPNLEDQKRIARLLGKTERLIAQRKQHLQQLDDLLKSVFLKMFGDPVRNEKGWVSDRIGRSTKVQGGFAFKSKDLSSKGTVRLVKIANVHFEKLIWDNVSFVPDKFHSDYNKFALSEGDLLIALTRPVIKSLDVVKTATVNKKDLPCLLNQRVARFVIDEDQINKKFLLQFCYSRFFKDTVEKLCPPGLQPNISTNQIEDIPIYYPPIDLQNQFAAVVEKVEGIKVLYQQGLADLETLYGALSQKAFKGDLDLSRVPLPEQKQDEAAQETKVPEAVDESSISEMIDRFSRLDMAAMSSAEGRAQTLEQWFGEWLNDAAAEQELSPDHFWQRARYSALDYQGDDDTDVDFSLQDYDLYKQWLFDAIAEGRIEQTRNKIKMAEKEEFGNQIVLKKVR